MNAAPAPELPQGLPWLNAPSGSLVIQWETTQFSAPFTVKKP